MPLGVLALLCAVGLYVMRWLDLPLGPIAYTTVGGVALLITISVLFISRRQWETRQTTIIRMEDKLALNNQLTMAEQGLSDWPKYPEQLPSLYKWKGRYLLPPVIIGGLALLFGAWLPVPQPAPKTSQIQEPLAWSELERDLDELREEEVVEEEYIEEKEAELQALRDQEPEDWYDHSSLEATDHLLEQHTEEKQKLAQGMLEASEQLQEMQNGMGDPSALKSALNQYQDALQGMEDALMQPNEKLLAQISKISPESLKNLSPEQVQKMRERLENSAEKLDSDCKNGQCDKPGDKPDGKRLGDGDGDKPGPGQAGIDRGPGHDEYLYGDTHERLQAEGEGKLEAQDLTDFTPGDLLQLQDGAPEANPEILGIRASGEVKHQGAGGDRVWKQALLPKEQQAIKSYYSTED